VPVGAVKFDFKMQSKRVIRHQNAPASQLSNYCGGPCTNLRERGGFKMPAWLAAHPDPPKGFGNARPRCDLCYDRTRPRDLKDGSYVIMEPADHSSFNSDDSSFILDPEPLVDSVDACKVTELVSTSTATAKLEVSYPQSYCEILLTF
jgi:hypothetical protein